MEPTRPNYRCRNLILGSLVLMGGCTVGPNYHPPKSELPSSYAELNSSVTNQTSLVTTNTETLEHWWMMFEDSELNSLIQRALQGNRDLRLALSRVREARGQRGVVAAGLLPEVDVTAGYNR